MKSRSQAAIIETVIMMYLDKGLKDKSEIFSKVVEGLGVPRPTVRRVSRDLLIKLQAYVKILAP